METAVSFEQEADDDDDQDAEKAARTINSSN
jgi:hypothetical protein